LSRKVRLLPPGYFSCGKILNEFNRFRDLVLHYIPFAGYEEQESRSLKELLAKDIQETKQRYQTLKKNIDEMIPPIKKYLYRAGIETKIKSKGYEPGSLKIMEKEYDIILDIFQLPHRLDAEIYDMLISTIDRGIGFYKRLRKQELINLVSPISWIAYIFRIPLLIIQRTGLVTNDEGASLLLKLYIWVVRLIVLLILLLIAKKLGIENLIAYALKFF